MIKFLEKILGGGRAFTITVYWATRDNMVATYDLGYVDQAGIVVIPEGSHSGLEGTCPMCIPWKSIEWIGVNFAD